MMGRGRSEASYRSWPQRRRSRQRCRSRQAWRYL